MGCDIHVHVEVKIGGEWHHYNHPRIERDSDLFRHMSFPIHAARGLPEDISFTTHFDSDVNWGSDGHSHSWLSAEEVVELIKWKDELDREQLVKKGRNPDDYPISFEHFQIGYIFGMGWEFKEDPEDSPKGLEDARLVFWFDN